MDVRRKKPDMINQFIRLSLCRRSGLRNSYARIIILAFIVLSLVYSMGYSSSFDKLEIIKQEFTKEHPELVTLKNYLDETQKLYNDLKNKYFWAKRNNIVPSQEARLLSKDILSGRLNSDAELDQVFSKLPWGGWSRQWSKMRSELYRKVDEVKTTCLEGSNSKKEISIVLGTMVFLRTDYEDLLNGKTPNVNSRIDSLETALKNTEQILLLDGVIKRKERLENLPQDFNLLFDLYKGKIDDFDISNDIKEEDLFKLIGEKPDKIKPGGWTVYNYFSRGFSILLEKSVDQNRIGSITVYTKDSEWGDEKYEKFKGTIVPLGDNEDKETIRQKFGNDFEVLSKGSEPLQWRYKKEYGKICFVFDEKSNLKGISVFCDIKQKPPRTKWPEVLFGLTEDKRKKFAYEHDNLCSWAEGEAAKKYPNVWDNRRYDYEDSIFNPKEKELLNKYGLTEEQAGEIIFNEAQQKKWF